MERSQLSPPYIRIAMKPWLTWHSLSWWAPVEWGGPCSCPRPVSPAGQGDSDKSHTVPAPGGLLCWCTAFWNASVKFSSCLKQIEKKKIEWKSESPS